MAARDVPRDIPLPPCPICVHLQRTIGACLIHHLILSSRFHPASTEAGNEFKPARWLNVASARLARGAGLNSARVHVIPLERTAPSHPTAVFFSQDHLFLSGPSPRCERNSTKQRVNGTGKHLGSQRVSEDPNMVYHLVDARRIVGSLSDPCAFFISYDYCLESRLWLFGNAEHPTRRGGKRPLA